MNATALLVVDVQNAVIDECVDGAPVVTRIGELVQRARAAETLVVWVRHEDAELVEGSHPWQIVDALKPGPTEPTVGKKYGDSFADTTLKEVLDERSIQTVILCGAQSDACIRSTFYGGLYNGFNMTLVADAHATMDMRPFGMTFSPDDAIAVLNAHAGHTALPNARGACVPAASVDF